MRRLMGWVVTWLLFACGSSDGDTAGLPASAGGSAGSDSGDTESDPLDFSDEDDFDEDATGDDALDPTVTEPAKLADGDGDLVGITRDDRLVYTQADGVWSIKAAVGAEPRKAASVAGDVVIKERTIFNFAEVDYETGEGNLTFWTPAVGRRSIGKAMIGADQVAARHDDAFVMFVRNLQSETLDIVICSADKEHAQLLVEDAGRGSDTTCAPSFGFARDSAVVSWCTVGSTTATLARWTVDGAGVWHRADISLDAGGLWSSAASGAKFFYVSAAGEGRVTDMTSEQTISDGVGWGFLQPDGEAVFFTVGDQLRRSDLAAEPIPIVSSGFGEPVAWWDELGKVLYSSEVLYDEGMKQDLRVTPTAVFNPQPLVLVAEPVATLSRSALTTAGDHALYLTDVTDAGGTLHVRPVSGAPAKTFAKVHTVLAADGHTILFTDNRDPNGYPVVADLKVYTAGNVEAPVLLEIAVVDGSNIQLRSDKVTVAYQRDGEPYGGIWVGPVP